MTSNSTKLLFQAATIVAVAVYVMPQITNKAGIPLNDALLLGAICAVAFIVLGWFFPPVAVVENFLDLSTIKLCKDNRMENQDYLNILRTIKKTYKGKEVKIDALYPLLVLIGGIMLGKGICNKER